MADVMAWDVVDGTGVVWDVFDGSVVVEWTVQRGPISLTVEGGSGGQLPSSGTAGQVPQVAAGGASYELKTPNTPGGLLRLDDDGTIPDILGPSSFARDTEVAAAIAAGAVVLVNLHLPLAIEFVGGSFTDANTATLPSAAGEAAGVALLWTEQGTGSNNDIWVHQGGGEFVRSSPAALRSARVGTLIVSRANPLIGFAPQVLRIDAANSVEELVVTAAQVNALIAAATADFATESYVDDAVDPLATEVDDVAADLAESRIIDVESVVAVTAVDGTATTLQPLRRADGAPADGIIPIEWLAIGSPIDVDDWAAFGALVILPGLDNPASPAEWSKLYRVMPVGTPWELVTPPSNAQVFVNQGSDQGLPLWWGVTGAGRLVPMQVSAHNVRLDRHPTISNPSTVWPWTDLNEMITILARAVQWEVLDVDTDWTMDAGPNHITVVTADDVTITLPEPVDPTPGSAQYGFAYNRPYRVVSLTAGPVVIEDHLGNEVTTLLAAGQGVELIHNGVDWFTYGGPSATAAHTHDTLSNLTGPTIIGRTSGSGDSEELTAAQARTLLGQGWQVIDSFTFTGAESSRTVNVTGFNRIRLTLSGRSTRAATTENIRMTLNGNTGNVYGVNASALAAFWALGVLPAATTNTDRGGMITVELQLHSGLTKAGWSMNQGSIVSTSVVGSAVTTTGLFSTITAAVATLELFAQSAPLAAGSYLLVEGC